MSPLEIRCKNTDIFLINKHLFTFFKAKQMQLYHKHQTTNNIPHIIALAYLHAILTAVKDEVARGTLIIQPDGGCGLLF